MKLLAYTIDGEKIGVDITSWNKDILNGNEVFLAIEDGVSIPSGYSDISSITNWDSFGGAAHSLDTNENLDLTEIQIRNEIKKLLTPEQSTGNTSGLTQSEISILQEYNLDSYYTLYDYFETLPYYVDPSKPPYDYDYDILGLHKKRHFDKGELYKVEYYGDYDFVTDTYSKLLVHEDRTYYRINEMVHRREMNICWHLNNGLSGATKNTTKYYTRQESIVAGERRRRHIISGIKVNTLGLIMMTSGVTQLEAQNLGFAFLTQYADAVDVYIEGALQFLYDAILNDSDHSWLNNEVPNAGGLTIRQWMYNEVLLDYTINNTYV
jgi:hypothetical protein